MTLTIFGYPLSTYVRTARMACIEKAVPYRYEPITPAECKARGLHPFGKIPAMEHDGFRLFEAGAITRYLDVAFDGPALQPADRKARALMDQWVSAISDGIYDAMILRYAVAYLFPRTQDGEPDRAIIDAALPQIREQLAVLDEAYGEGRFLVGDAITLADLFLAPILFYVGRMPEGEALLAAAPAVTRGIAEMQARQSFRDTIPPPRG